MKPKRETEVLVVGAGPVGLFAAMSLAERGVDVEIIDKEWRGSSHSYALALHPRTLRLLDDYGAADEILRQGHRLERLGIFDGVKRVATLDFSALDSSFPFLLVVPQSLLESTLEERLKKKKIRVHWNHRAETLEQSKDSVHTKVARLEKFSAGYPIAHTEWMVARETDMQAAFVVGADGYDSAIRRGVDLQFEHMGSPEYFWVQEFETRNECESEAKVVFQEGTVSVLWPLGNRRSRWSLQVKPEPAGLVEVAAMRKLIHERAPWFNAEIETSFWTTTVIFERRLVERFGKGRVWLAGDAAHVTGPIGVQSMNVGFREGHDLAERISAIRKGGGPLELMDSYEAERQAEWRALLGSAGKLRSSEASSSWARNVDAKRLLPCIPASGDEMQRLLGQLGLALG